MERALRSQVFVGMAVVIWFVAMFFEPSQPKFFSTKFELVLVAAVIGGTWAVARMRAKTQMPLFMYFVGPLLVVAAGFVAKVVVA
ncbi:MAG: hypothetical protein WCA81_16995 [Rhizomicrobium sp.]